MGGRRGKEKQRMRGCLCYDDCGEMAQKLSQLSLFLKVHEAQYVQLVAFFFLKEKNISVIFRKRGHVQSKIE